MIVWVIVAIHLAFLIVIAGNLRYLGQPMAKIPPGTPPRVSILIPARNEAENLRRLLPGLLDQAYPSFEVIVYNDASTDATADVLRDYADPRLRILLGEGPPPGWVGKVHALYQATQHAGGDLFLFLDADTELLNREALQRLVAHHQALPAPAVMTVLPRLRGGGMMLVSNVSNAILTGLPWPLVRRFQTPTLGAVNGQCWMVSAALYRTHQPHAAVAGEILEDVMIGRYLKRQGVTPALMDGTRLVAVHMYGSLREAFLGFRKNAYLLLGGRPAYAIPLMLLYATVFTLAPVIDWRLAALVYLNKAITDWRSGISPWITLGAPLSFLLGSIVQVDSMLAHLRGRVSWKGRTI